MLFILSVNPLSFLLSLLLGCNIAKTNNKKQKLAHLFFVDDLKSFARNEKEATLQLDLITQFTKDIDNEICPTQTCIYLHRTRYSEIPRHKTFY